MSTPPLPAGYTLDQPQATLPPLPKGYTLDSAASTQQTEAPPAPTYDAYKDKYGASSSGLIFLPKGVKPPPATPENRQQFQDEQSKQAASAMQMMLGGGGIKTIAPIAGATAEAAVPVAKPILKGGWQILDAASFNRVGKIWDALKAMGQEVGETINPAKFPGANLPEKPAAELLQARTLAEGGKAATEPASAALGRISAPEVPPRQPPTGGPAGPFPPRAPKVTGTVDAPFQGGRPEPPRLPPSGGPAGPYSAPPKVPGTVDAPFQAPARGIPEAPPQIPEATSQVGARVQNTPVTLSGEGALRQILTGQDNANLMKIARARGVNITQEAQLKAGIADSRLIDKIINDFTPEELDEVRSQFMENTRFRHAFGDIGPEAWKTMSLKTFFPDVKISAAQVARTQKAITNIKSAAMQAQSASEDLSPQWEEALKRVQAAKAAQ